jgi:hypothetical protein
VSALSCELSGVAGICWTFGIGFAGGRVAGAGSGGGGFAGCARDRPSSCSSGKLDNASRVGAAAGAGAGADAGAGAGAGAGTL